MTNMLVAIIERAVVLTAFEKFLKVDIVAALSVEIALVHVLWEPHVATLGLVVIAEAVTSSFLPLDEHVLFGFAEHSVVFVVFAIPMPRHCVAVAAVESEIRF